MCSFVCCLRGAYTLSKRAVLPAAVGGFVIQGAEQVGSRFLVDILSDLRHVFVAPRGDVQRR